MNQEYFGTGSIHNLSKVLSSFEVKKIFLVTGNKSYESSGTAKILNEMLKKFRITHFNEFSNYPKLEDIKEGIKLLKESKCKAVVAVGGGSVIDIAKCINILSRQDSGLKDLVRGKKKIKKKGRPLIAIPTTAGSGSEATHFAVVYIDKEKHSLTSKFILPDVSIVDPQLTFNLPASITATSGIDALCQAVESYWSINSNDESKNYSCEAIKLILQNLESAVNNPSKGNRVQMSKASNLAGKAINITKTTAPHAVSYSLTSYFGIPHGQAVSITLPEFLEFNYNVSEEDAAGKNVNEVKNNIEKLFSTFGCKSILEAKQKIKELMKSIGLKTKLSELGINREKELELIINNVNTERLQNNPRTLTKESLQNILRNIL